MTGILSKERIIAQPDYNRWRVPVASVAIHLCIGSVYAWSIYNPPLTRVKGVVASAADDWSLSAVVWVFTVAIVSLGLAAAFAGKWLELRQEVVHGVVVGTEGSHATEEFAHDTAERPKVEELAAGQPKQRLRCHILGCAAQ